MRIAILTWFHYQNYGTALQVSALYNVLKNNEYNVDVIRYYPRRKGKTLPDYSFRRILHSVDKRISALPEKLSKHEEKPVYRYYSNSERESLFDCFLNDRVTFSGECKTLSELESLNCDYDAFICGSDQIWSPNNFDPHYFLDFVSDPNKLISYAPSIGLPRISDKNVYRQIKNLVSRFKHLSIREEQGADLIYHMIGSKPAVVADPTLLLTFDEWEKTCKGAKSDSDRPYLLAYFLGHEEEHWSEVYRIAKEKNLSVLVIPVFENDLQREGCITSGVGPSEFVELIKNAKYVCTDSYHGTLFSMQFQKQFSVFERFGKKDPINQNSRLYTILSKTNTIDRLIPYHGKFIEKQDIEYNHVSQVIETFRQQSKEYLFDALQSVDIEKKDAKINHILSDHSLCCGCGACAEKCPKDAITISLSEAGFYCATVDESKCIQCGQCKAVCQFESKDRGIRMEEASVYSYKDSNTTVLKRSSSGGAAYRLANKLLENGYYIAGCTFDAEKQISRHILIKHSEDLNRIQGSKYMQSRFSDVLQEISACNKPVAVFGSPCQIAAAKKLFRDRKEYVYIELICHGVPTYHLYRKYKQYLKKEYGMSPENMNICFRYKPKGWREIYIYCTDGKVETCFSQKDDPYFQFFETTSCYSDACYDCKWRDRSVADIRLGDFWGPKFETDNTGVSIIACLTEEGRRILSYLELDGSGRLEEQEREHYLRYQQTLNETKPVFHDELIEKLKDQDSDLIRLKEKYSDPFSRDRKPQNRVERYIRVAKNIIREEFHL